MTALVLDKWPYRGFLPQSEPATSFKNSNLEFLTACDEVGKDLPDRLGAGNISAFRGWLLRESRFLADLKTEQIRRLSKEHKFLLMVRLSFFVSAYVYVDSFLGCETSPVVIPESIAIPFLNLAETLKVPPILSYTFYCLNNWERFDKSLPVSVGNTRLIQNFLGGLDERHFILVHLEIEKELASGLAAINRAQDNVFCNDYCRLAQNLEIIADAIEGAVVVMRAMTERCDPEIYYKRVRPFIFGFNLGSPTKEVIFEGARRKNKPKLKGETGAQTPSFPAIWAALGIEFPNNALRGHVQELRAYLLPEHQRCIKYIEAGPSIRNYVKNLVEDRRIGVSKLMNAYNRCIKALSEFFGNLHQSYAVEYIFKKEMEEARREQGTGGTPHMKYLAHHAQVYENHLIS